MGRPTKPTELKLLEGNKGKRATNKREPDPDYLDNLDPPAWMPEEAAVVWRELAFKLRKAKVLTVLDVPALEKMCVAIATYRRATLALNGAELVEVAPTRKRKARRRAQRQGRPIGFVGAEGAEAATRRSQRRGEAGWRGGAVLNPWLIVQSMAFKAGDGSAARIRHDAGGALARAHRSAARALRQMARAKPKTTSPDAYRRTRAMSSPARSSPARMCAMRAGGTWRI
jgi:phage terminase small subunit